MPKSIFQSLTESIRPVLLIGITAAILFGATTSAVAQAADEDDPQKQIEKLVAVLENLSKTPIEADTPAADRAEFEMIRQRFSSMKSYLSRKDYGRARGIVRTWARQTKSEDLRRVCNTLAEAMAKETDGQLLPLMDRFDDLLAEAKEVCLKAESPDDLDDIADKIYEFQNFEVGHQNDRKIQRLRNQLSGVNNFISQWQQYVQYRNADNHYQALNQLQNLSNYSYSYGYNVRVIPAEDVLKVKRELEREARKDIIKQMAELSVKIDDKTTIEQVEQRLADISEIYNKLQYGNNYAIRNRVERTRNTVQTWLFMLDAEQVGDHTTALQQLQTLSANSYRDPRVLTTQTISAKRDELIKQIDDGEQAPGDRVAKLITSVKDAQSAAAAVEELTAMISTPAVATRFEQQSQVNVGYTSGNNQLYLVKNDLSNIANLYRAIEEDRMARYWELASVATGTYHPWTKEIANLRADIKRQAVTLSLGIESFEPADEDESVADGLLRLADEAGKKDDWQASYEILDLYARAFGGETRPAWLEAELAGCRSYLAGLQLEKFGQKEQAIISYTQTLKQIGERIPHEQAAARLKALQKDGE